MPSQFSQQQQRKTANQVSAPGHERASAQQQSRAQDQPRDGRIHSREEALRPMEDRLANNIKAITTSSSPATAPLATPT